MATALRAPTISDLMRLGSDARVEVANGEVMELAPVGGLHNLIAKNVLRALDEYVEQHQSGVVFTDSLL